MLCPTLFNPVDCSMPASGVCSNSCPLKSTLPSIHLILCHVLLLLPQSFPASGSFPSGGQSIGASASASVPPMNIQGWFPLGLTSLIFLQSKGLSRIFSSTTAQKHQFPGCWDEKLWLALAVWSLRQNWVLVHSASAALLPSQTSFRILSKPSGP